MRRERYDHCAILKRLAKKYLHQNKICNRKNKLGLLMTMNIFIMLIQQQVVQSVTYARKKVWALSAAHKLQSRRHCGHWWINRSIIQQNKRFAQRISPGKHTQQRRWTVAVADALSHVPRPELAWGAPTGLTRQWWSHSTCGRCGREQEDYRDPQSWLLWRVGLWTVDPDQTLNPWIGNDIPCDPECSRSCFWWVDVRFHQLGKLPSRS